MHYDINCIIKIVGISLFEINSMLILTKGNAHAPRKRLVHDHDGSEKSNNLTSKSDTCLRSLKLR